MVHPRHYDHADGQKLAEGEEDLNSGCPRHTHTVKVYDGSYKGRQSRLCHVPLYGGHIGRLCVSIQLYASKDAVYDDVA